MKSTKRHPILFGIVSMIVIFSIMVILNKPTDVEATNMTYTLEGLPADIVAHIETHRITTDLSREEMEKKFEKYLYTNYTSLEEGLDQIPRHDKIKSGGWECMSTGGMLTYEEAKEDVHYLFTNLKYGYAGYGYFGGDEKFNKVKSQIVEALKESKDKHGRIGSMTFDQTIINHLSFIKDGHFRINFIDLTDTTYAFMNQKEIITKEHNTFYVNQGDKKYPILSIEEKDPVNYIKPSLDQDGKIIYKIVYLKDIKRASLEIHMTLTEKEKKVQRKLKLKRVIPPTGGSGWKDYTFKEIQGIPVFTVSSFHGDLEKLSKDGLKYADKKIAILDVRGNRGGSCEYGWQWISNFTKNDVRDFNLINAEIITEVSKQRVLDTCIVNNMSKEKYKEYYKSINPSDLTGWTKIVTPKLKNLKNDKVVIVLFDKNSASASEGIISNLSYMDNVIFIGVITG